MGLNKNRVLFVAPTKTTPVKESGTPVQKIRSSMSLPGATILGAVAASGFETLFLDLGAEDRDERWWVSGRVLACGASSKEAARRIAAMMPEFVLITSMFTFEHMVVDKLVRAIKRACPGVCVILGGAHASVRPEWHFEESNADFIVIGEGEETIVELLRELACKDPDPRRVCGIAFRGPDGRVGRTTPRRILKKLDGPWCYDKVLLRDDGKPRYIERECRKSPIYVADAIGEDVATFAMLGSRGCPHRCKYCTATIRTGRSIRHMGAERMFSHFQTARLEYGAAVFCNQADTFGLHSEDLRFLEIVRDYRRSSLDRAFVLNNPNAFFLQQFFPRRSGYELNLAFLDLLVEAGFNTVTVAIETLSQRFNHKVDWSGIPPEQLIELCQAIREREMRTDIYMMYGFPDETVEEFDNDLRMAEHLMPCVDLITWNSLSLLPGTDYYEEFVVRPSREGAYRKLISEGYGCYYPIKELNLSQVSVERFRDALVPYGQSWI